jgi:pentatricopeptide repeat protein
MKEMFVEMTNDAGIAPTERIYCSVLKTLGENKKMDEMKELFTDMVDAGVVAPSVRIYTTMLDALGKNEQIQEMFDLFSKMKTSGIAPDFACCSTVINILEDSGEEFLVDEFLTDPSIIDLLEKHQRSKGRESITLHFHAAQCKKLYLNVHELNSGVCRGILRRALRLMDGFRGSGREAVVVVGKGLHTKKKRMVKKKVEKMGREDNAEEKERVTEEEIEATAAAAAGEGSSVIGPVLLKYLREELKRDCKFDPNNAGRILVTL